MKKLSLGLCLAATVAGGIATTSAALADTGFPNNLRIVIGSKSTGGDTYQNTAIVAEALAEKLDINVKVDAVGATAAFKTLKRVSNGSTIMMFHDQSYLGYLYGRKGYENPFEEYRIGPTVSINPGSAYLVAQGSPFQGLDELMTACADGTDIRVAIQPGGVSEIGYSAMKNAIRIEHPGKEGCLVAVNRGSQSDKNQAMFDGLADLIHGSVQANEQYTRLPADDQKAMRFVWLTARNQTIQQANPEGMGQTSREDLLQYVEPNVSVTQDGEKNFTFDKEFFFLFNKDMDPALIEELDQALTEIFAEGEIQETQKTSFFIPNFMPSAEAEAYLKDKMSQYATIIDALHN
ncbi:ABC transporter substrate-binding protein [Roseospira visakhapatnamensis]|uniref:Tripartite-type tricarboxylate transporter receptor subunit TctC n=1 Tax=Roseospira visakhapatnamensis TaxID=390880 RepID=A0A7W6RB94_9PROT|nr:ABC transporter substrate-binding protein [Roseospira visakhapatnamensis]MBB4264673.1 tripartite-type tricarboxylate transporter receptor subunit TctC [Roseospira visakhapatnamensis]